MVSYLFTKLLLDLKSESNFLILLFVRESDGKTNQLMCLFFISLRNYLAEIDGCLHLDKTYIRHKLRTNDKAIMDIVRSKGLTTVQEHRINCVRMYLGVMYVSEISTIDGNSLREGMIDGSHNTDEYIIKLTKPRQIRPNTYSWLLWKRVLDSITSIGRQLKESLGQ